MAAIPGDPRAFIDKAMDQRREAVAEFKAGVSKSHDSFRAFYDHLTLLSGGIIAASLTYLGYLQRNPGPINHRTTLIWAWLLLCSCIIACVLHN